MPTARSPQHRADDDGRRAALISAASDTMLSGAAVRGLAVALGVAGGLTLRRRRRLATARRRGFAAARSVALGRNSAILAATSSDSLMFRASLGA